MRLAWIALLCAPLLSLTPHPQTPGVETYGGFVITEGYCSSAEPPCRLQGPKPWSADDLAKAKQAIDEIKVRASGDNVIRRIQTPRRVVIRRFTHGRRGEAVDPAIAASFTRRRMVDVIELYDRFFHFGDSRDLLSGRPGYRFQTQNLLHELLHALDQHSDQQAFHKAAGFIPAGSSVRFSIGTAAEVEALSQWEARLPILEKAEDYVGQLRLNRRRVSRGPFGGW